MLTKMSSGSPARADRPPSRRVCAWTPSTAETTSTTPSSTRSERSTSATKSACPGVSIRLTLRSSKLKRDDRGLDRDAASALELQRVGLRRAFVDAADRSDDAGFEEDAFGEARFTGVYMRQDPDIDNRHADTLSLKKLPITGLFNGCRMGLSSRNRDWYAAMIVARGRERLGIRGVMRWDATIATACRQFRVFLRSKSRMCYLEIRTPVVMSAYDMH